MALVTWALPQLSKLLPLDEESLKQIIAYNETLPKDEAAENLKTLVGDTPKALDFIATFNSRRHVSSAPSNSLQPDVPQRQAKKKKKQPFNKLPPVRTPENHGDTHGAYLKNQSDDYIRAKSKPKSNATASSTFALEPNTTRLDVANTDEKPNIPTYSRLPPSAAGKLISAEPSRLPSPATKPKTKIRVQGGVSMHGQASTINDLDSAIRSLEIQTNPTLVSVQNDSRRQCNCMATRHALLTAAPNCLNCGKIICVKEGLGPCTFCHQPLLSTHEIQEMMKVLVEQRGKEKMEINNASHKRAEVSKTPRPFSNLSTPADSSAASSDSETERLGAAKRHRDKLLRYQAENARRTHIHDEVADFETQDVGLNMWASPQERALQLKKQQKVLREQEWNSKPEYEKRRQVVSIDLVGKTAIRHMANVERPEEPDSEEADSPPATPATNHPTPFSRNPLLGQLIRPVYPGLKPRESGREGREATLWRRVQDENEDNEQWILDGGALGGTENKA